MLSNCVHLILPVMLNTIVPISYWYLEWEFLSSTKVTFDRVEFLLSSLTAYVPCMFTLRLCQAPTLQLPHFTQTRWNSCPYDMLVRLYDRTAIISCHIQTCFLSPNSYLTHMSCRQCLSVSNTRLPSGHAGQSFLSRPWNGLYGSVHHIDLNGYSKLCWGQFV